MKLTATMLTGCCSIGVVTNLTVYEKPDRTAAQEKSEALESAEASAKQAGYHAVMATISSKQEADYKWAATMKKFGWKLVNESNSKPYGGGRVFMYVKNLD